MFLIPIVMSIILEFFYRKYVQNNISTKTGTNARCNKQHEIIIYHNDWNDLV